MPLASKPLSLVIVVEASVPKKKTLASELAMNSRNGGCVHLISTIIVHLKVKPSEFPQIINHTQSILEIPFRRLNTIALDATIHDLKNRSKEKLLDISPLQISAHDGIFYFISKSTAA